MDFLGSSLIYGAMPQKAPQSIIPALPQEYLEGVEEEPQSFDSVLQAAMGMVNETNNLQNEAQNEEVKFELGLTDNAHDLMIAEQKASIALQYTVAVRDRFMESYNTIMNMQI